MQFGRKDKNSREILNFDEKSRNRQQFNLIKDYFAENLIDREYNFSYH